MFVMATSPTLVTVTVNPITPPGKPLVAGQSLLTSNFGEVRTGQITVALVVIAWRQTSIPVAVTMFVIEQTLAGTGSVPLSTAPWPGSNRAIVPTGVLAVG